MARVGRLAGAILAETNGRWFLVGNPKEPCDFEAAGFVSPGTIDAIARPYVALEPRDAVDLEAPWLELPLEGEALAERIADRMLIRRNASVSERLWMLVIGADEETGAAPASPVDAEWLVRMPGRVWEVVRDSVLRCV